MRARLFPLLQRRLISTPRPNPQNPAPQLQLRTQLQSPRIASSYFHTLKSQSSRLAEKAKTQNHDMETLKGKPLDRAELDNLLRRTLFYTPSFEIYGAVSGFYDYGPPGTALNANIVNLWRRHFVLEENMLELEYALLFEHVVRGILTCDVVARLSPRMKYFRRLDTWTVSAVCIEVLYSRVGN